MKIKKTHRWDLSYHEATALQSKLRKSIRLQPLALRRIHHVAGADVAISKRLDMAVTAIVVYTFPELELVESRSATAKITFPYIPGLLSFREVPGIIACLCNVQTPIDIILCDGQGIAHPRGVGLASHLGLLVGKPTIGCAKSRLVGEHAAVGPKRGNFSRLHYEGRQVGSVLRTRDRVKPLYISPGHLMDHASSRRIVLACSGGYRLPEPTRRADRLAGEERRKLEDAAGAVRACADPDR